MCLHYMTWRVAFINAFASMDTNSNTQIYQIKMVHPNNCHKQDIQTHPDICAHHIDTNRTDLEFLIHKCKPSNTTMTNASLDF